MKEKQNYANFHIQYVHVNINNENISHVLNTRESRRSREAATEQRQREKNTKSQSQSLKTMF